MPWPAYRDLLIAHYRGRKFVCAYRRDAGDAGVLWVDAIGRPTRAELLGAIQVLLRQDCRTLRADCDNPAMKRFWEKLGFQTDPNTNIFTVPIHAGIRRTH